MKSFGEFSFNFDRDGGLGLQDDGHLRQLLLGLVMARLRPLAGFVHRVPVLGRLELWGPAR